MMSSLVLASSNNHKGLAICQFVAACLGLYFGFVLSGRFGVAGVVYGLLGADLLICGSIIPWKACRLLGQNFASFASEIVLRGIPVLGVLYIIEHWMFSGLSAMNLAQLLVSGLATLLLGLGLGYLLWLNSSEKARLRSFLSNAA